MHCVKVSTFHGIGMAGVVRDFLRAVLFNTGQYQVVIVITRYGYTNHIHPQDLHSS